MLSLSWGLQCWSDPSHVGQMQTKPFCCPDRISFMGPPAVMESCTQTQKESRVAPYLLGQLGQIHMVRGQRSDFRRSANAKRIIVIISLEIWSTLTA